MPKLIDNYVLQEKIGAGQFGDVYHGYHQQTKQQVAIKTIKRETIKGKFYELLQNQIKVLKTCDNPNIIKLYAIKKTANHFYLMMEYCNEGDMLARVKKYKKLPQAQVIKYLCQILNAFQALTMHKIMHRDFKLANILLNDGGIKIADFGFAKLLNTQDYANTMLGSPLNMAPQVLGGNKYNNKADIWSIGACVYQMLYGKPPYVASNMVDLLKMIKTKPVYFPPQPKINDTLKDVIKKMLVVDSKKRISWSDLFCHPINRYLDNLVRKQINLQLSQDQSLLLNTSKYYLKKNLFIDKPSDIQENQEVNEYLRSVIKNKDKGSQYKGQESMSASKLRTKSTSEINVSQTVRKNSKKILHYRNIYAFLASVADQIINQTQVQTHQLAAYVMVKKILTMISWLKMITQAEQCPLNNLQNWSEYCQSPQLQEIKAYVTKQYDVFNVFNDSLEPIIKQNFINGKYEEDVKLFLNGEYSEQAYKKYIKSYIKRISKKTVSEMLVKKQAQQYRQTLKHIQCTLIACESDLVFGSQDFDFKAFHESFEGISLQNLLLRIERMLKQSVK